MSPSAYPSAVVQGDGLNTNMPSSSSRPLTRGIYVPTIAFFNPDTDELDLKTTSQHAVRLARSGVTGLAVQGSNGEAVHLTHHERNAVTKATRSALDAAGYGNMPVLVGCGAQSTVEAVDLCKQAQENGGDYALVLPPSYYSALFSNDTVTEFFNDVADASPIPIIVYNYPGATSGLDINSDTLISLSRHPNIAGCKFTCGNTGKLGRVAASVRSSKQNFLCFAGSADFTISSLSNGGAGVIGGLANVAPKASVKLFDLVEAGETDKAMALQAVVAEGDWAVIQTGVVGVKVALMEFFGYGGWARRPLPRPDGAKVKMIVGGLRELVELEKGL